VNCAKYLNEKFGPFDNWIIQQGSILDSSFVNKLGKFDIVYSWGVLHHTGKMWTALENASMLPGDRGILAVSIYNDQGLLSRLWTYAKYVYNKSPRPVQWLLGNSFFIFWAVLMLLLDAVNRRSILARYRGINARGMNAYYDAIDWIGGYPFEVATPEKIFNFYKAKDFKLEKLMTRRGMGCNEFVFKK
jgi:2-polyprenyl-6-hydroxyphenyl methylase/3-demethylubiquinone-9 3-methyltransferase